MTFRTNSDRGGLAIEMRLTGERPGRPERRRDWLKERLRTFDGVTDISSSDREGKREIKLQMLPQAEATGLRLAEVSRQVRQSFYGEEAQRLQRGRDEIKVMVRYPREERLSVQNLADMKIRTPQGTEVPILRTGQRRVRAGLFHDFPPGAPSLR